MEIVGLKKLDDFAKKHGDLKEQLKTWRAEVSKMNWENLNDIKEKYVTASFLGKNIVVFNIKGNHYRLVIKVSYKSKKVLIKNIGTHAEYSKWVLK